ncbi:MAG: DUF58 domain-containing protein [Lentisphaeria bacterium]|nr:DUF58 domain-containing protein [Lentisphaeria bacterium]NQZ68588.1 DUF58 domain-containing protein [Lentisphaeria bacterium]
MILANLKARVKQIEIKTSRLVTEQFVGLYHSAFMHQGIEFSELREYVPGDDISEIDWYSTAKFQKPYIKTFVEERELPVHILVDISGSMISKNHGRAKLEIAAELAGLLSLSAIRNNNRVSLTLFSNEEKLHLPLKRGRKHWQRIIHELLSIEVHHEKSDFKQSFTGFNNASHRRGIVFIISDFIGAEIDSSLRGMSRHHDTVAIRLRDYYDSELPEGGLLTVEDPETGRQQLLPVFSKAFRKRYTALQKKNHDSVKMDLLNSKVDLLDIGTEGDSFKPLIQFFKTRHKRKTLSQ